MTDTENYRNFEIQLATTEHAIAQTFQVMRQLRPALNEDTYVGVVQEQMANCGYKLSYLLISAKPVCVAGFRSCRSLGWGSYLYVDELITDSRHRSTGCGSAMFRWLIKWGRDHGCGELRLDSALERHDAHRFYLGERMDIACFHFMISLNG
jgi:GNAT superfamily N-acetyltransferase